ncbi:hypothetical protein EON79_15260 [bacterium]|nr:MAG: hypothetical protein EON79_15260 [bacterium]
MGRIYLNRGDYAQALPILAKQEESTSDGVLFAEIALARLRTGDAVGAERSFACVNGLDSPQGFEGRDFPGTSLECRLLLKIAEQYAHRGYGPATTGRLDEAEALAPDNARVMEFVKKVRYDQASKEKKRPSL